MRPGGERRPVLDRTLASGGARLSRATVAGGKRRAETQVSPAAYLYSRVRVQLFAFVFRFEDRLSFHSSFLSIRIRIHTPHLDLRTRSALIQMLDVLGTFE